MRIFRLAPISAVALTIFAVDALADGSAERSRFRDLVEEGRQAYRTKQYASAIQKFRRAYRLQPEPELIFNVARSHEKALNADEAIEEYERFLKLPGSTATLRKRALRSLEALHYEKSQQKNPTPNAVIAEERNVLSSPMQLNLKTEPDPTGSVATLSKSTDALSSEPSILSWVLMGGGTASIVAGGVFGTLALNRRSDYNSATDLRVRSDAKDAAQRNATFADILIGTGVASAAVGLTLYLLDL